jgi:hypothetical protein
MCTVVAATTSPASSSAVPEPSSAGNPVPPPEPQRTAEPGIPRPGVPIAAGSDHAAAGGYQRRTSAWRTRPRPGTRSSARWGRPSPAGAAGQHPGGDLADHEGQTRSGRARQQWTGQTSRSDQREEPKPHINIVPIQGDTHPIARRAPPLRDDCTPLDSDPRRGQRASHHPSSERFQRPTVVTRAAVRRSSRSGITDR